MGFIDSLRNYAGAGVEGIATTFNLPETGLSERIAGNNTPLTGVTQQSQVLYPDPTPAANAPSIASTSNNPQVLRLNTQGVPVNTSSGGGGGPAGPNPLDRNANPGDGWFWDAADGWKRAGNGGPSGPSQQQILEDRIRGEINAGYGNYDNMLTDIFNTLPGQAESQRQTAFNQQQVGENLLGDQQALSSSKLQGEEDKTIRSQETDLKSLAESMRNQFRSGQNYLGSRGAGDSSAVNQYSYALTKMGNKARGDRTSQTADIVGDINQRRFEVEQTFNSGMKNIQLETDNKVNQIATWLAEQQNNIRNMKGELGVNRGRDLAGLSQQLLGQAMAQANSIKEQALNKQTMLEQWAMQQSQGIDQLASNMQGVSNIQYNQPAFQGVNGSVQGGQQQANRGMFGGGGYSDTEEQNRLFGLA